jgi:hypothetical protein
MSGAINAVRLRQYLLALSPPARALLRVQFERAAGSEAAVVLDELRRLEPADLSAAARLFFQPLECFLVDDVMERPFRLARSSLPQLWHWLAQDLLRDGVAEFSDTAGDALAAGDVARASRLARDLQDRVAAAIRAAFAESDDQLLPRRLLAQLGTPRAADEVSTLRWALRGRDALAALSARLPATIDDLPPQSIPVLAMLIENAARPRDVFAYALLTLMRRMAAPWQIVRLAVHAAGNNGAARVADTPYGVVLDIFLADLDCQIAQLGAALACGDAGSAIPLIRAIGAGVQGLRGELTIPVGCTLARRLAAVSAEAEAVTRAALASARSGPVALSA